MATKCCNCGDSIPYEDPHMSELGPICPVCIADEALAMLPMASKEEMAKQWMTELWKAEEEVEAHHAR